MMRMLKHVQNALNIPYGTKSATFFWHLEPENAWFDNEAIIHMPRLTTQFVRKKIMYS